MAVLDESFHVVQPVAVLSEEISVKKTPESRNSNIDFPTNIIDYRFFLLIKLNHM